MTRFRKPRRWLLWVAVAAGVVVVAAGIAAYVILSGGPGDVSNPNVEFRPPTATQQAPTQPKTVRDPGFLWPFYGYDKQRTRYLPLQRPIHPPYRRPWNYRAGALLEFPPVLSSQSLFVLKDDGMLVALARKSGRVIWGRKLGALAASSPAVAGSTIYVVILQRKRNTRAGRVVALNVGTGRKLWSIPLPSRAESSPVVANGTLYFGSEDGTVYALRTTDGSMKWRYHAAGAVKGGLALDQGRLFFGDYAGQVYSIRASTGRQIWRKTTSGARFGFSSGQFYATAAVAYGRVYMGNTDGFVYSYAASTGKLAWRIHTGGYVYGSAAVAQVPGGIPTVYVGSYDRRFYALDARSGRKLWVANAGGRVSGGAVVIGDTVWFSTLEQQTRALGARTGALLFKINRGQFNPVVSDGERIYLVGHSSITALEPRPHHAAKPAAKRARQKALRAKKAQARRKAQARKKAQARAKRRAAAKRRARAKRRRQARRKR
jgi:outer membrane protein assembly factor BamB